MTTVKNEIIAAERLVRVEEKQKAMTTHIASLTSALRENTIITTEIKRTLDELTGTKKFLMWLIGLVVGIGTAIATYVGIHHK